MGTPKLVVFSGLPGTGKTTLARRLSAALSATYLRLDVIEQALIQAMSRSEVGPEGYAIAGALAESNLSLGNTVIVDCVNPVAASREFWTATAARATVLLVNIEVICSDRHEHRRRVEQRAADIVGHVLPTWQRVDAMVYEPWLSKRVAVDTALVPVEQAVAVCLSAVMNPSPS